MRLHVPSALITSCQQSPELVAWLDRLPSAVARLCERWSLSLGEPFEEATAAWVAPAFVRGGGRAVLKLGLPHMEAAHEIAGLRHWAGDGMVELLADDEDLDALLIERCEPGTPLRLQPETTQDEVIAGLLKRLWRKPPAPDHPFRPLSEMAAHWVQCARDAADRWPDRGLVEQGIVAFEALAGRNEGGVVLATDLHAGNVMRAQREPWLAIDPKPFLGDPAYDATQHLFNCCERLYGDPHGTIGRVADLLGVSAERVERWVFARAAIETGGYADPARQALARALAP